MDKLRDWVVMQAAVEEQLQSHLREDDGHHLQARDSKLQTVRRIDWRFLLPDPHLRHVAYLGPENCLLLETLDQFSEALTIISPNGLTAFERKDTTRADLFVLHSLRQTDLEIAKSFLKSGGYLYWEIDRSEYFLSVRKRIGEVGGISYLQTSIWEEGLGLRHFWHYTRSLERLGFCNISVNWHRPNFESCVEIIPLDEPSALRYVFSRSYGRLSSQLKSALGQLLMRTDLLGHFVICLSLVARKPLTSMD